MGISVFLFQLEPRNETLMNKKKFSKSKKHIDWGKLTIGQIIRISGVSQGIKLFKESVGLQWF